MSLDHTQDFLSFTLGGMEYGLDARQVREVCLLETLERFADGAQIVPGVARARGMIMPLVDLRTAFAGHPVPLAPHSDVIILTLSQCVMGWSWKASTAPSRCAPTRSFPCPASTAPRPPITCWDWAHAATGAWYSSTSTA